jgi:hypothetical protein
MKRNSRVCSAVVLGLGALLLTRYVHSVSQQKQTRETKKMTKREVQSWEGEGGALVAHVPRATTGAPASN